MRRRAFIKMIAGSAVALPLAAHAQQPAMPVIGFLGSRSAIDSALQVAAFRQAGAHRKGSDDVNSDRLRDR
jgi:putative ABC transport system substrate-binding protein